MSGPAPNPRHENESVLPRDWAELTPLLDRVLDAAPAERAALIVALAAGDLARQRALEQLVAECERDLPLLNAGAAQRFDALAHESEESLLPELIAERYRTGRELGRGGMARVYLARDTKHGRDVAIKVIRAELSASLGHERFLREIDIAARLRHPNIVPLYDSGEVGGSLYFVMPFEEGRSVRERLRDEGALPIADALSVLRDVARALAYAHEHGVVHRDVKPDNVMLSGGAAVVTDFGIAKAVSVALTQGGAPTLTQTGSGIGTPAYMAPEQAMGDPATDHRADIYSFGCLAYELFAGLPPFPEATSHQVVAAHLTQIPRPVTERRADVPAPVAALIAHCLEKLPADRPQHVRDVLAMLDGAATTTTTGAGARASRVSRASRRTWVFRSGAALVALVLGLVVGVPAIRSVTAAAPVTLAVLPFGNTNADSAVNFVEEGLADEVASALSRVPGILIKSRSGARRYRGQLGVDVAEAGSTLKADYIMHGVVRLERGRWILAADVARASDATSIWADVFAIDPNEQAGAVGTITRSVVAALQRQFPRSIGVLPAPAPRRWTTNNEAARLYLRGQERLSRRRRSVVESADLFRQAIREDTLFAAAYSGLSMSLALYPYFQGVPSPEVLPDLVEAAGRALALDPSLSQPHVALGMGHWFTNQWDSAGASFEAAIRIDPNDVEARVQYARHLRFLGRFPESMRELQVAREQDPASALVLSQIAYAFNLVGQPDSALTESRRAIENDSLNLTSLGLGAMVRLQSGRLSEAREFALRAASMSPSLYIIAKSGDSATARRIIRETESVDPAPWLGHTRRAFGYLGLGDTASALTALEQATDAGENWASQNGAFDPMFSPVRRSARFQALVRRVGLTDPGESRRR